MDEMQNRGRLARTRVRHIIPMRGNAAQKQHTKTSNCAQENDDLVDVANRA
jgi:hypothetical protein